MRHWARSQDWARKVSLLGKQVFSKPPRKGLAISWLCRRGHSIKMYIVVIFSYVYIHLCIKTLSQTGDIELEREWHVGHTTNTSIYLTLKKASGIKYCYLLPKAWNLHGCFFNLPVNASICLSNTKPHCVAKLRASTQRCALRVLELLRFWW